MPGSSRQQGRKDFAEREELDLLHWVQLLWDNIWWIGGFTLTVFACVALYTFLATPMYSATATIYVQSQNRAPVSGFQPIGATTWMEEEKFYNSQQQIMTSRDVMQGVVDKLDLRKHQGFAGSGDPAGRLRGMVKVEVVRDSALFKVTVLSPYQADTALWANAIAEVYAEQNLRGTLDYVAKVNAVMLDQARRMQEEYTRQQREVSSSLQATGSYFPQNQKEILDKRIENLELKLNEVAVRESEVSVVAGQMSAWKAKGGDPLSIPAVADDPQVRDLVHQYNEMDRDMSKLAAKFTPKHPEVKKKQEELQALRDRIGKQAEIVYSTVENQLLAVRGQKAQLQRDLDEIKRQGLIFVEGNTKDEALATGSATIKKYMDLLYDKMRELNVGSSLLSSNIRLVDPATPPGGPVKPNKQLNLILGFLCGLLFSVGSVIAVHYLDTTVKSVDDVESRLGINLLAMIPLITKETERAKTESFQSLRTALIYASDSGRNNTIVITSPSPKEGKSSVAVSLARTLAASGDKVLLMDCDLRRPSINRFIPPPAGGAKGLSNFLAEQSAPVEQFIFPGGIPNLEVFYSGPSPPNPPELFSMKRFRQTVEVLRSKYTWVIVDTPPALSITDAQIIAGLSDLVLLVARYRQTQKTLLDRVLVTFKRLNVHVAGLVLNAVETSSSYYYDYYYYNHYYYQTGSTAKKLPWILGKVGGWRAIFKGPRKTRVYE